MRYVDAATFLFSLRQYEMRPGTDATAELLAACGNPQEGPDYIQIAGSNGKGSTARMLESILRESGLDVGLYTSPHMDVVRDRIRINGQPIPKRDVTAFVESIHEYVLDVTAEGNPPTYFETMTTLALWYFGQKDVDVAVLEVGIGGPKDATSVVDPVASAVTSVTLEHTAVLGDTIEAIAAEKAGIAPSSGPLVTGTEGNALAAVRSTVDAVLPVQLATTDTQQEAPTGDLTLVTPLSSNAPFSQGIEISGLFGTLETTIPLLGPHQCLNAGIAATLAAQYDAIETTVIARGLASATFPGRFETIDRDPLVILDGAHNPGACSVLRETLADCSYDQLHVVFGAMRDKDHRGMITALPKADRVTVCAAAIPRAAPAAVLKRLISSETDTFVKSAPSVEAGLEAALEQADSTDCILITGSLATVREARRHWTRPVIPKRSTSSMDTQHILDRADITTDAGELAAADLSPQLLQTSLLPRQARRIQTMMHAVGGKCLLSGLTEQDEEPIDVLLTGTTTELLAFVDRLQSAEMGLSRLSTQITTSIEGAPPPGSRWSDHPVIMGILNVTPDSFHDGGSYGSVDEAVTQARSMVEAGASIIDIGGESTRPGADPVTPEEERERILPVIEALAPREVVLSVDTRRASVAKAALEAGADIINDVSGLEDPAMAKAVAEAEASIVLMHSLDAPVVPNRTIAYDDVVHDVLRELTEAVIRAEQAGIDRSHIIIDPGLGFGKTAEESFTLLDRINECTGLHCPILVGHSQKSMFKAIDQSAGERLAATIAGTTIAADRGADIIRVHDVPENIAAVETVLTARQRE